MSLNPTGSGYDTLPEVDAVPLAVTDQTSSQCLFFGRRWKTGHVGLICMNCSEAVWAALTALSLTGWAPSSSIATLSSSIDGTSPSSLLLAGKGAAVPISAHYPSLIFCPERQRKMNIALCLSTRMWVSFAQAPPISVYAFWYLPLLPTLIPAIGLPFCWFSVTLSLLSQSNLVFWSRKSGSEGMNSVVNCKHPWGTKCLLCHHFRSWSPFLGHQ